MTSDHQIDFCLRPTAQDGPPLENAASTEMVTDDEATVLAAEFVRLLTDDTAPRKGYVLLIGPHQLMVRNLEHVRNTIQSGLVADDLTQARASLNELAHLLGL
jgi:hypothetical protein